jgi:hypothetical protein
MKSKLTFHDFMKNQGYSYENKNNLVSWQKDGIKMKSEEINNMIIQYQNETKL